MGWLDFFRGKDTAEQAPAEAPEVLSPWASKFRGFRDWDDDRQKATCKEFLTELGADLEHARLKTSLDFDDIDIRGRLAGVPVKVETDATAGWVSIDTQCHVPFEDLSLSWDLDEIPVEASQGEDVDDWGDEDQIRVFVAKGVYAEGGRSEVEQVMSALGALPDGLGPQLLSTMQDHKLSRFGIYSDGIHVGFDDNLYEMADPKAEVMDVVGFTAEVARALGPRRPEGEADAESILEGMTIAAPLQLSQCSYCSTRFNLATSDRCPNCGAACTA